MTENKCVSCVFEGVGESPLSTALQRCDMCADNYLMGFFRAMLDVPDKMRAYVTKERVCEMWHSTYGKAFHVDPCPHVDGCRI